MRKTIDIMGVPVDFITAQEAIKIVEAFMGENVIHTVYTPNSEIMMAAQGDPYLKDILCQADLIIADGAGVVLASKILGSGLPERVTGVDLVKNTFLAASKGKIKFFLLGGQSGIAEIAGEKITDKYPGVEIVGYHNGYFKKEDEATILEKINSSSADVLLVALGAPKQEIWIHEHKDRLKIRVCMGIGGTLDILACKVPLAPEFFRRNSLEWLYRLYREPWRFKRMLDLPRFILLVLAKRFKQVKRRG